MRYNILIISALLPPEPVVSASISHDLASSLAEKHYVHVVSPRPSRPSGYIFNEDNTTFDYRVTRLSSYTYAKSNLLGRSIESFSFGLYLLIFVLMNGKKYDKIYISSWPIFSVYFALLGTWFHGKEAILHIQDIYPESFFNKKNIPRFILNILIRIDNYFTIKCDQIVVNSEAMFDYFLTERKIDLKRLNLVYNWQSSPDLDDKPSPNLEQEDFIFMYLGNIGPVANLMSVIEAFTFSNLENVKLVIAGSGSQKKSLSDYVLTKGLQNIEFWNVPEGQVYNVQSKAHVLILPLAKGAGHSSFPSKLPAYMFSKRPIIVVSESYYETAKSVKNANCGWQCDPNDIYSLSETFRNVKNRDLKELLTKGESGYQYAKANFSKEVNLARLRNVFFK